MIEIDSSEMRAAIDQMVEEHGPDLMERAFRRGAKRALGGLRKALSKIIRERTNLPKAAHIARRFVDHIRRDGTLAELYVRGGAYDRFTIHPNSKPVAPDIRMRLPDGSIAANAFSGATGVVVSGKGRRKFESVPAYWSKRFKVFIRQEGKADKYRQARDRSRVMEASMRASDVWQDPRFGDLLSKALTRMIKEAWYVVDNPHWVMRKRGGKSSKMHRRRGLMSAAATAAYFR